MDILGNPLAHFSKAGGSYCRLSQLPSCESIYWSDGYFVASVSNASIETLQNYIANQRTPADSMKERAHEKIKFELVSGARSPALDPSQGPSTSWR